jgi:exonuclease III
MSTASLTKQSFLKLMQLNAENLFLYMDRYSGQDLDKVSEIEWQKFSTSTISNKNLKKAQALANAILEVDPHIVLLNEVGGEESLNNFNQHFLKKTYLPMIVEGNSDRGIDVGYLVKEDPLLQYLMISHKHRPLDFSFDQQKNQVKDPNTKYFFSRDVLELRVFRKGEGSPRFICFLTHLKSKLDPDGTDPQGRSRRRAELQTMVKIYNEANKEMKHQVPLLVAGDFNGLAYRSACEKEFESLYENSDLIELFDLIGGDEEARTTQIQFLRDGLRRLLQLDYFFLSPALIDKVEPASSFVYRYKSDLGVPMPLSTSIEQRLSLPSDHYPVVLTIKNPLKD